MEEAAAALTALQQELHALQQEMTPAGQAVGESAGSPADLSLGKPIGEAVGKLVAQAIDEPTGHKVGEAVRKAVDDVLDVSLEKQSDLWLDVVGSSVRASVMPDERPEEPPAEARAGQLLAWLASTYPKYAGRQVAYPDLQDHLYPRFQAQTGCKRSLDSVVRGLNKITDVHSRDYLDRDGKRRTVKEYLVPDPATVVELAEEKRKRCA